MDDLFIANSITFEDVLDAVGIASVVARSAKVLVGVGAVTEWATKGRRETNKTPTIKTKEANASCNNSVPHVSKRVCHACTMYMYMCAMVRKRKTLREAADYEMATRSSNTLVAKLTSKNSEKRLKWWKSNVMIMCSVCMFVCWACLRVKD